MINLLGQLVQEYRSSGQTENEIVTVRETAWSDLQKPFDTGYILKVRNVDKVRFPWFLSSIEEGKYDTSFGVCSDL